MIRVDLHCHTGYSHDSFASLASVLEHAAQRELTHLAITDHDAIEGALRARDQSRQVRIIVGCEVSLADGTHLIGLFLEQKISAVTCHEAIEKIQAQHGFVVIPHPFNPTSGLFRAGDVVPAGVDAVEVCNGYEPPNRNAAAGKLARAHNLAATAGSDAHYGVDVGRACVEFPDESGELTADVLRRGRRILFAPTQNLATLHAGDAAFRANMAPRLRQLVPRPVRRLAKRANWERFQQQIQARLQEPVRKEFCL